MIGINRIPIQWLLLIPHSTGNSPIRVAITRIIKPINPVNKKTRIATNDIVSLTIKEYGTFAKLFANIFPTLRVKNMTEFRLTKGQLKDKLSL